MLLNNSTFLWLNLLIARSRSCAEASVGLDGFIATNAIAAAAHSSVLALVMRTSEKKRVRLNQRGVFICLEMLIEVEPLSSLGTSDSELEGDRQEFLVLHFCNVEPNVGLA